MIISGLGAIAQKNQNIDQSDGLEGTSSGNYCRKNEKNRTIDSINNFIFNSSSHSLNILVFNFNILQMPSLGLGKEYFSFVCLLLPFLFSLVLPWIIQALVIIQMVTIEQLSRGQPSSTQCLDLRSSKKEKIHRIDGLQLFTNLRELNLANNMIARIENLALPHLRILNLEFNQITRLEGMTAILRLEELFLSYNSINYISKETTRNKQLRVLHLAYNDLQSIEDIRPLSGLPALSILTLVSNPFLESLNYIAFVKMLIPSLLMLDDKDASQSMIAANVYPHEEIFILRDALNKLLDERNNNSHNESLTHRSPNKEEKQENHQESTPTNQNSSDLQTHLELLKQWISNYERRAQAKRKEINQLSQSYSECMRRSVSKAGDKKQAELLAKISKYRQQQQRGQLSEEKKQRLRQLSLQLEHSEERISLEREQCRTILQLLKTKESEFSRLKQKIQTLTHLKERLQNGPHTDVNKIILSHILYGTNSNPPFAYKDLKRLLSDEKGLLQQYQFLNLIIFGQQAEGERVIRLKQFLGDKSLIEIINDLKEMGLRHKKDRKKYQRQRSKLLYQFETEAQELCDQWRELQREKEALKNSRNFNLPDTHPYNSKSLLEERYSIVESEERSRIMLLKKEKEHYQRKLDELQQKCDSLQVEFERKYKELEEFQNFFEEFKKEREIVSGLKEQIEVNSRELGKKKDLLRQLQVSVNDLSAKEENLLQKSSFYQRKVFQKSQELKMLQERMRTAQQKTKKAADEFNLKNYECIGLQEQIAKQAEELRDYEKRIERQKSSLQIYQQKLRNLSELESNKRSSLANLQAEVEAQRKHYSELVKKVQQSQQKLNRCVQSHYQYQLKIQESKKSLQSLADINRTITDMMERQTQLKRSIFQLELENQHLQEIKAKMINEIKIKYDDQDQSL